MSTVTVTEDQTYVFKPSDFTSSSLVAVKITSLPTTGTLYLNGVAVTLNQVIFGSDVSAGKLTFVPNTDVTVTGSFTDIVTASTSTGTVSTTGSTTLSVTPDTGPSASPSSVQVTENQTYI